MKNKLMMLLLLLPLSAMAGVGISNSRGLSVSTCSPMFDGSICSVKYKGVELVDKKDAGRLWQSAVSYNQEGEANNPTEGGAMLDGLFMWDTRSVLLSEKVEGYTIKTCTQMAYWLRRDGKDLSNTKMCKQVFLAGNIISYKTEFWIPQDEGINFAQIEVLTGYMPTKFSVFYRYNVNTDLLEAIDDGPGENPLPVVFSTPDGSIAVAAYVPKLPQSTFPDGGFGRWRFPDVVKWNHVMRFYNPSPYYSFQSYVVVGDLATVKRNLRDLMLMYP